MANTQTLLDTLNSSREETITKHYNAAFAELQDKIQKDPLKTLFIIHAGCVSKNITDEIARRFNAKGLKASYGYTGIVRTYHCLEVEVTLPAHLVPPVETVAPVDPITVAEQPK